MCRSAEAPGAQSAPADPLGPEVERERAGHAAEHEATGGQRPEDGHRAVREGRAVRDRAVPGHVQEVLQHLQTVVKRKKFRSTSGKAITREQVRVSSTIE